MRTSRLLVNKAFGDMVEKLVLHNMQVCVKWGVVCYPIEVLACSDVYNI
jgi:hypothetical protein